MRIPFWVWILALLAWVAFISSKYLSNCGCCGATAAVGAAVGGALPAASGTLDYRWGSDATVTGSGFDTYKSGILAQGGQGDTLVITGLYRSGEKNTSTYENIGIARAEAAKKLFIDKVGGSRIRCSSKLVEDDMNKTDLHGSADFSWIKAIVNMKDATIIESGDETSILFPTGSAAKTDNPKVDAYLKTLITRLKSSDEKVLITGHTDNKGDVKANEALGLNRASAIRRVLVDAGVPREQITVDSKGPAMPVATNDTEEGRYQNRRVVLKVTK
jgi:OmpA-OmpF porin, OOP family